MEIMNMVIMVMNSVREIRSNPPSPWPSPPHMKRQRESGGGTGGLSGSR